MRKVPASLNNSEWAAVALITTFPTLHHAFAVSTVVGGGGVTCGWSAASGDGGQATSACLLGPSFLALESASAPTAQSATALWVSDSLSSTVWRVDLATSIIRLIAGVLGTSSPCSLSESDAEGLYGTASSVPLCTPAGITVSNDGTAYVVDSGSNTLRYIYTSDASRSTGWMMGFLAPAGDGVSYLAGLAFNNPSGLFISSPATAQVLQLGLLGDSNYTLPASVIAGSGNYGDAGVCTRRKHNARKCSHCCFICWSCRRRNCELAGIVQLPSWHWVRRLFEV